MDINASDAKFVGGIVGNASSGTIKDSSFEGTIVAKSYAGGLVGMLNTSTVENCEANATIEISPKLTEPSGDVIIDSGAFASYVENSTIKNSSAAGSIENKNTGSSHNVHVCSGFVAVVNDATIIDCDTSANVKDEYSTYAAGFLGAVSTANTNTTIKNCNMTGDIDVASTALAHNFSAPIGPSGGTVTFDNCYSELGVQTGYADATSEVAHSTTVGVVNQPVISTTYKIIENPHSGSTSQEYIDAANLFDRIQKNGYTLIDVSEASIFATYGDDNEWLTNMINLGELYIYKTDSKTGDYYQVNLATDTNLQEVSNEANLKKAEAKYEASMRQINAKDKKFDTDLAALEAERNAIKTEMDTLKSVAKENVDRTYKLFS